MKTGEIVIIDLEDVEAYKECPTPKQSALCAEIGQFVIPVAYKSRDVVLGTEESAESVTLISHRWMVELLYSAGESKITVQIVPEEYAKEIAFVLDFEG
jgi:hypothetical protein